MASRDSTAGRTLADTKSKNPPRKLLAIATSIDGIVARTPAVRDGTKVKKEKKECDNQPREKRPAAVVKSQNGTKKRKEKERLPHSQ